MKKRIIAIMLSVMMVVTFIPTIAFANETGGSGANAPAASGEDISVDPSEADALLASAEALTELIEGLDPMGTSQETEELINQLNSLDMNMPSSGKKGIALDSDEAVDPDLIEKLENLLTKLDREISLVDLYLDWFANDSLFAIFISDDLQNALNHYLEASTNLKTSVKAYINASADAEPDELTDLRNCIKEDLNTYTSRSLGLVGAIYSESMRIADVIKTSAESLKPKADLSASIDKITDKVKALTEELEASLDSYTKLKEAYSNLKTTLSKYGLLTPEISSELSEADLALDTSGDAIKKFFDNMIASISNYLKENLNSSATSTSLQTTLGLLKSYKKVIDKQIENILKGNAGVNSTTSITSIISTLTKIIDFVKSIFGDKDAEKISQLEEMNTYLANQTAMLANAASITQAKPSLKSVKSKNRKVTGKWGAVSTGTVSYYQVYYKVKGKSAVNVKVDSYDAAAKTISYTTKKLAKGKKCTFKVRGVYKMVSRSVPSDPDSAKITSTYYTNWSTARTVTVK